MERAPSLFEVEAMSTYDVLNGFLEDDWNQLKVGELINVSSSAQFTRNERSDRWTVSLIPFGPHGQC